MSDFMSRPQLIFLMLLSLGITNHVLIIPHLISSAGRDSWVSVLFAYPALLLWSLALYHICSSVKNASLLDWLRCRIGKTGSLLIIGTLLVFVIFMGAMIVYDTTKSLSIYILPRTPNPIIVLSFVTIVFLAARAGLRTIVYMSTVLLPIVWLLGFMVAYMTSEHKDYSMLLPMFSEGISPTLRGLEVVFGGSMDLLLLLLLLPKLNKPLRYSTLFWILTLLVGLVMGPTMGAIAAFGPDLAGQMRFPAFELWRLVMIGRYISHIDFLAVFQMLAGSVIRSALCMYLAAELTGKLFTHYRHSVLFGVSALFSAMPLLHLSDITFQRIVHDYFYRYSVILGIIAVIGLLVIRCIPNREGAPL
ncbi:endospore germination permease [Paenibacillus silviterrae]|uniref:endospore germination permease n=1 Tax=Paenibacillus silviterrae TaxID=3242194 RepID=UPI0025439C50|nr:endospore germination permease [Paenibacillus chinjuensis]